MKAQHRQRKLIGAVGVVLALAAAACGSSKSTAPTTTAQATSSSGASTSAAASTTAAASTSAAPSTTEGGGPSTKALVIDRDMDFFQGLDPGVAYCDSCQIYLTAIYETLIGLDPHDNKTLVPRLATKWDSNDAQTQFTFTLNSAAKFADGTPVTSKDVKFSWLRLKNLKGAASYLAANITSIDTPDNQTVIVKFDKPNSAFLAQTNASYMGITNSALAMKNGATDADDAATTDKAGTWFNSNSAGSGPFELESYKEGSEVRLKRNDNYWGKKANFPEVIMKEVKDAATQRQDLESGAADIAMQISNDVAKDMKSGSVIVTKVPSFNYVYVALSPGAKDNKVPLDANVRKAIQAALDYDGILDVTVGGSGHKQASPIPNGFLGSAGLPLPQQDVAKAKQLLAAAGHPNGFDISFEFPTANVYGVDFATLAQKVQTDLKAVGINASLTPADFSVWGNKIGSDGIPITILYFAPDHTDTSQYIQYFAMVPNSQWSTWTGVQTKGQEKPTVDQSQQDLLTQAFATKDLTAREKLYNQLGQKMIDDAYILTLVNPDLFLAYQSNIVGMAYSACCNLDLASLGVKQ